MFDFNIDWERLLTDNTTLIYNAGSVLFGLLMGMWLRGRFIDKTKLKGSDVSDFVFFALALLYITGVGSLSNWPVPFYGYAIGGLLFPPVIVPLYNGLVSAAPDIAKKFLPGWLVEAVLKYTKPPSNLPPKGNNNE